MARHLATLSPEVTQEAENIPPESAGLSKETLRPNTAGPGGLLLAAVDKHHEEERSSGKHWPLYEEEEKGRKISKYSQTFEVQRCK